MASNTERADIIYSPVDGKNEGKCKSAILKLTQLYPRNFSATGWSTSLASFAALYYGFHGVWI